MTREIHPAGWGNGWRTSCENTGSMHAGFFIILAGRGLQFALMFAMMRVATTLLSPQEMGRMSLLLATTAFFALFLVNPVGMFINRRLHSWAETGMVRDYLRWYWVYAALVGLAAALILTVLQHFGLTGLKIELYWLLLLVCGSLVFNTANQTVIPSLNLLGFPGWFVALTLATIALGFIVAILLTDCFQATAEWWLLGILSGQAVLAFVGARVLFNKLDVPNVAVMQFGSALTRTRVALLFAYAWPISLSVGLNWLQTQSFRFVTDATLGLVPLGLFVAGYGVSVALISAFESIVTTYLQPQFYRLVSKEDSDGQMVAWRRYAGIVAPSLILTVVTVVCLAPELAVLMLGPAFHDTGEYIIWGALAEGARVLTGMYSLIAHAHMRTRTLLLPSLAGAGTALFLGWFLIPIWGLTGAGVLLTMAGAMVVGALHLQFVGWRGVHILAWRKMPTLLLMGITILMIVMAIRHAPIGHGTWQAAWETMIGVAIYVYFQFRILRNHTPRTLQ